MSKTLAPLTVPLLALLVRCGPSAQGGQLAATEQGDTADAPAERSPTLEAFVERCGSGDLTQMGEAQLDRMPYLQLTTAHSTRVVFSGALGSQPTVDVTTPNGELVTSVPVTPEPGAAGGRQWFADIQGLQSDTFYCYAISGLTDRAGLRTAPAAGKDVAVRFVVVGDSGSGSERQSAVLDQIETVAFDLMLHTGDIAYESGKASELEANFFDVYSELLKSIPVFPTSGNHDYETNGAAPFREAFALPENGGAAGYERWFSFDWGDVHFVALDTQVGTAEQAAWLEQDLSRNLLPWTIVYLHKPPFSSGDHGGDSRVRAAYVPLFERYGVDVVFAGHDHDYERSQPINGVTYIVTGAGGYNTRGVGHSWFTAYSQSVLHFVYGELSGGQLHLHAIDGSGAEFDALTLEH